MTQIHGEVQGFGFFFSYFLSVIMQLLMHFKGHNFSLFNTCVNQTGRLHSSKLSIIAMPCTVSTK